jgi:hypothetical protein
MELLIGCVCLANKAKLINTYLSLIFKHIVLFSALLVGLSDGTIPHETAIHADDVKNSFAMVNGNDCYWLNGEEHVFEWPIGAIKPEWKKGLGDVVGCGIMVNREDKLSIFFTGNGKLMGEFNVQLALIWINNEN